MKYALIALLVMIVFSVEAQQKDTLLFLIDRKLDIVDFRIEKRFYETESFVIAVDCEYFGENNDFATTYDALQKKYGKETQHKIMINYIEVMKKNLSDLYNKWPSHEEKVKFMAQVTEKLPGKNLDFIFEVMARSGLKRTAEGKQFYDANKNNYDMVTGFLDECLPVNCPF